MADVPVNYLGKLIELGQKCKFIVDSEVIDVGFVSNIPNFKCIIRIPSHDIMVEQIAKNKKSAKSAAAQLAYKTICEKIDESVITSVDQIATKLKNMQVSTNNLSDSIEFAKKIASLDVSKIVGHEYAQLSELFSSVECEVTFNYDQKTLDDGNIEYQFICGIHPKGTMSPIITGTGWSSIGLEEAKTQAIDQIIAILKTFSTQPESSPESSN